MHASDFMKGRHLVKKLRFGLSWSMNEIPIDDLEVPDDKSVVWKSDINSFIAFIKTSALIITVNEYEMDYGL